MPLVVVFTVGFVLGPVCTAYYGPFPKITPSIPTALTPQHDKLLAGFRAVEEKNIVGALRPYGSSAQAYDPNYVVPLMENGPQLRAALEDAFEKVTRFRFDELSYLESSDKRRVGFEIQTRHVVFGQQLDFPQFFVWEFNDVGDAVRSTAYQPNGAQGVQQIILWAQRQPVLAFVMAAVFLISAAVLFVNRVLGLSW